MESCTMSYDAVHLCVYINETLSFEKALFISFFVKKKVWKWRQVTFHNIGVQQMGI